MVLHLLLSSAVYAFSDPFYPSLPFAPYRVSSKSNAVNRAGPTRNEIAFLPQPTLTHAKRLGLNNNNNNRSLTDRDCSDFQCKIDLYCGVLLLLQYIYIIALLPVVGKEARHACHDRPEEPNFESMQDILFFRQNKASCFDGRSLY